MGPVFLSAVKTLLVVQAMQGTVVGRVLDAETAEPIAGAAVTLCDLDRAAATDETGSYVLRQVPPGEHELTVHFIGFAERSLHVLVPEKGQLEIDVWLLPQPVRIHTVDVRAPVVVRGLDIGASTAFPDREISAAAMRNDPQLTEPDAFEALGGGEISLRPESPSGVNIRGGASDQTAYLLDGIPIFNPYHSGGLSSGWNPDAVSKLRLASAAPLPGYPNTLSGAIEAVTRDPGSQVHAQGSVSTTQSRITSDGPLGSTGAGYLVSVRSGLPDGIAPKTEPTYLRGEDGDWLAKLESPALGGRIQFLGYGNENELNTAAAVGPEDGAVQDPRRNTFEWTSRSVGAQWKRVFSSTAVRVLGWRADTDAGSAWTSHAGPVDMAAARRDKGLLLAVLHHSARTVTLGELRVEQSRTSYRIVPRLDIRALLGSRGGYARCDRGRAARARDRQAHRAECRRRPRRDQGRATPRAQRAIGVERFQPGQALGELLAGSSVRAVAPKRGVGRRQRVSRRHLHGRRRPGRPGRPIPIGCHRRELPSA
jgi:hypothetical protein